MTDDGNEETLDLPVELVMRDAGKLLEQQGMMGLGRAVQVGAALLGDVPQGEKWIADILAVYDAVDVLEGAYVAPGEVIPERVSQAISVVVGAVARSREWGIAPEERARNAIGSIALLAESIRGPHDADVVRQIAERFLSALGVDR